MSNILRYVTEEISDDFVPLEKEISLIKDYLNLERLRVSNKTQIDFKIEGDLASHAVPPMLLMTFIENAFKFGISSHEESVIAVRVIARDAGALYFNCKQNFDSTGTKEESASG